MRTTPTMSPSNFTTAMERARAIRPARESNSPYPRLLTAGYSSARRASSTSTDCFRARERAHLIQPVRDAGLVGERVFEGGARLLHVHAERREVGQRVLRLIRHDPVARPLRLDEPQEDRLLVRC